jgi:hypothetical protein
LGWFGLPCCSNPLSPGPQDYRELFEAVQPGSDKTLEDKFYEKEVCGMALATPPLPLPPSLSDSPRDEKKVNAAMRFLEDQIPSARFVFAFLSYLYQSRRPGLCIDGTIIISVLGAMVG